MQSRGGKLALAVLVLIVIAVAGCFSLRTESLRCARLRGEPAGCTFEVSAPLGHVVRFLPGEVSAIEIIERARSKSRSARTFAVALLDPRGARTEIRSYSERTEADALRRDLEAFLADTSRPSYVLERRAGVASYLLFAAALGASALLFSRGLRKRRSELPSAFPATYGNFQEASALTSPAPASPQNAGSPDTAPDLVAWSRGLAANRWVWLVGTSVAIASLSAAVIASVESRQNGTLEIEAESRCRFQGMELLPGGSMSMSLPPDRYSYEVYDPAEPSHWVTRELEVTLGETTRVVCRPALAKR